MKKSLSARRAWIEIGAYYVASVGHRVALRKESVDRNVVYLSEKIKFSSRSPQGERG